MSTSTYEQRRGEIEHYFDRTAADAWARLTSDAPVGRIRATVRAGRDRMRDTLLGWLPQDLRGARVLDAGCGTGSFSVELACRGADVVAIDLAAGLVKVASERAAVLLAARGATGRIDFRSGDMADTALGHFDHVVAMDSLIHYSAEDMVTLLRTWSSRVNTSMVITFAPANPALLAMHALGRLFPRGNRSPSIAPVAEARLREALARDLEMTSWTADRSARVSSGFYTSQAFELRARP